MMARNKCPNGHAANQDGECSHQGCTFGPTPKSQVDIFHSHNRKGLRTERVEEFGGLFGPCGWEEWVDVHCTCGHFMGKEEYERFVR